MNILEALKCVDEGEIVRYEQKTQVWFIIQATFEPIGDKSIIRIRADAAESFDECPKNLNGIDYAAVDDVCLDSIRSCSYKTVTFEEMMAEIQEHWKSEND